MSNQNEQDLHPAFLPVWEAVRDEANAELARLWPGSKCGAADTLRQRADQALARANGASQWDVSWHEFGQAVDYKIIDEFGNYVTDGEDPRYALVGTIGKKHGCVWGGDWHSPDWDHLEWHVGYTMQQLIGFFRKAVSTVAALVIGTPEGGPVA